jgi:hypothetical protein
METKKTPFVSAAAWEIHVSPAGVLELFCVKSIKLVDFDL